MPGMLPLRGCGLQRRARSQDAGTVRFMACIKGNRKGYFEIDLAMPGKI
jgi:hypothetical protein